MTELLIYPWLVRGVVAAAVVTFVVLWWVTAPYGRHVRPGWGPTVHSRWGWVLMEAPALFGFFFVFLLGRHREDPVPSALLVLWLLHYGYRGTVYPFLRRGGDRPMPLVIVAMGASFNVVNSYVNARWVSELHRYTEPLGSPHLVVGGTVFLLGWAANQHSDAVLRRLRRDGELGWSVPRGGLYRWVSCPNYLGEIVEWAGWAIAAWSPAGLAFLVYTLANLVPRAHANHVWYQTRFPDYPRARRRLVPGIW